MTCKRPQVQILPCSPRNEIMSQIQVKIENENTLTFNAGTSVSKILSESGIKADIIGAKIGERIVDLQYQVNEDSEIKFIKNGSDDALFFIRHTSAHVMAEAVQKLFPGTKVTIGPVIENGFYYDFDYPKGFTEDDLELIEKEMNRIIEEKKPLVRNSIKRSEAIKTFDGLGENFKVEIINDLPEDEDITLYDQGGWFDLCRGPHAPNTGYIKAFKLLSVAGAYWRGRETNPMLQRIYGTALQNGKD